MRAKKCRVLTVHRRPLKNQKPRGKRGSGSLFKEDTSTIARRFRFASFLPISGDLNASPSYYEHDTVETRNQTDLQPNSERADENQPGFVGPGCDELGLADYSSGCYLSPGGKYGPYADLRFYLRKESEDSGQPKQVKVSASQNQNCRPKSDDPHYFRRNVEILDRKYKVKVWIRQNPATALFYVKATSRKPSTLSRVNLVLWPKQLSKLLSIFSQD